MGFQRSAPDLGSVAEAAERLVPTKTLWRWRDAQKITPGVHWRRMNAGSRCSGNVPLLAERMISSTSNPKERRSKLPSEDRGLCSRGGLFLWLQTFKRFSNAFCLAFSVVPIDLRFSNAKRLSRHTYIEKRRELGN